MTSECAKIFFQAVEALLNKPLSELLISVGEPKVEEEPEMVAQEEETGLAALTDKMVSIQSTLNFLHTGQGYPRVLPGQTILISPMLSHPGPDKNHMYLMHRL